MRILTVVALLCLGPKVGLIWFPARLGAQETGVYSSPKVKTLLGAWSADSTPRVFCLVHHHDYGELFIADSLVAIATPAKQPWCAPGVPVLIDASECPPASFSAGEYPFVIVRCEAGLWRRFDRRFPPGPRT